MVYINTDASTTQIEQAIKGAVADLERLVANNTRLIRAAEAENWRGIDKLQSISALLMSIYDEMEKVADLIGIGGQIIRDSRINNEMITNATESSLTGA